LTSSDNDIPAGTGTDLEWTTTNATRCWASGGEWAGSGDKTPLPDGAEATGALSADTTYFIMCENGSGGPTAEDSHTVTVLSPPLLTPPTVSLSALPMTVDEGGTATLTWTTTNDPTSCDGSQGGQTLAWSGAKNPARGSMSTGPLTTDETYVIKCTNDAGDSIPRSVTITVIPAVTGPTLTPPDDPSVDICTPVRIEYDTSGYNPAMCVITATEGDLVTDPLNEVPGELEEDGTGEFEDKICSTRKFTITCDDGVNPPESSSVDVFAIPVIHET